MKINQWQELDDKAVAVARALAMDAAQKVGNGHPGTAMSLAPVAYTLFQRIMRHDPANPNWLARDRFILSCGHSSLTLYIQLYLSGYGVELEDLKSFRTFNAKTPGHPEYGHTLGVETTTGPLGQGVANGVGMAMAARYEKGLLDPQNTTDIFDHDIWVMCSDGDLQEGVSAEASSLAGTQQLGNLKVIYDDNRISIEGDTHITCTEDIDARYLAYGWEVIVVAKKADGDIDRESLERAMLSAVAQKNKPVLIHIHTVIAWPAPNAKGTSKAHGSALGNDEISATKILLGLNPSETFIAPTEVINHAREVKQRGSEMYAQWLTKFQAWEKTNNQSAELLKRLLNKKLPANFEDSFPAFSSEKEISTRAASGKVIQMIAKTLPEFLGGSADLTESNNTNWSGSVALTPAQFNANTIHYGVREFGMSAIMNGLALHGGFIPFGGTFLVFSDYARNAVRMSALMRLRVIYIYTHDSIGLGEDGPTHQPIEHATMLRTTPNVCVWRPADCFETAVAWQQAILHHQGPSCLLLSRQALPGLEHTKQVLSDVQRGGYILSDVVEPQGILLATGSEVALAVRAALQLQEEGIAVRVVSMPCVEYFLQTDSAYQAMVLPRALRARVAIEAGASAFWYRFVGLDGIVIGVDQFGLSAPGLAVYQAMNITVEAIVASMRRLVHEGKV